mgnify:CR=1 FL=1
MGQTSINTTHKPTKTLWSALANDSAIKVWMADLGRVVAQGKDWGLAGQAVVIEADDEEVVKELIQHVAEAAGIQLHQFAANGVLEEFPDWCDGLAAPEPSMVYLSAGSWQGAKFATQSFQHFLHGHTLALGLEVQEHAAVVGQVAIGTAAAHKRHHAQDIGVVFYHLSGLVLQLEHGAK